MIYKERRVTAPFDHPFIPVIVNDCMNCFWNSRNSMRTGSVISDENANICPQNM